MQTSGTDAEPGPSAQMHPINVTTPSLSKPPFPSSSAVCNTVPALLEVGLLVDHPYPKVVPNTTFEDIWEALRFSDRPSPYVIFYLPRHCRLVNQSCCCLLLPTIYQCFLGLPVTGVSVGFEGDDETAKLSVPPCAKTPL